MSTNETPATQPEQPWQQPSIDKPDAVTHGQPQQWQYPPPPNQTAVTGWPIPYQPRKTNGLAVAGFVLSLLWLFWLGSALAIVFGHIARSQIKADPQQDGDGLAIAALVLGYVGAVMFALFVVIPLMAAAGGA